MSSNTAVRHAQGTGVGGGLVLGFAAPLGGGLMNPPTTFSTIPGQGELADVPRDLRFHPSTTTDPKVLTPEQVARFNRDGYLRPFRFISHDEIAEILVDGKVQATEAAKQLAEKIEKHAKPASK